MSLSNLTKKRITDFVSEGKRFDGRRLLEYRDIKIEFGVSKNAEGSARVKFGNTEVVAGIKMDVSEPYADSANSGNLITTMELLPMSSPNFEPGPPRIEAVEMARIIDRGIRESGFIDFDKLCIKEGEKVWNVYVDMYSINDDGNLLDTAAMAAVAALKNARIPKFDEEKGKVCFGEWSKEKLPLTECMPITMTFHKVGKNILLDPVTEEEESSEARLSIAISISGKDKMINAMQKGNEMPMSKEEVFKIIDEAVIKWEELKNKVEGMLG